MRSRKKRDEKKSLKIRLPGMDGSRMCFGLKQQRKNRWQLQNSACFPKKSRQQLSLAGAIFLYEEHERQAERGRTRQNELERGRTS